MLYRGRRFDTIRAAAFWTRWRVAIVDLGNPASRLNRGGGPAIVYRRELNAKAFRLQLVTKPLTFKYKLGVLKTNSSTSIIIINIHRPPSPWRHSHSSKSLPTWSACYWRHQARLSFSVALSTAMVTTRTSSLNYSPPYSTRWTWNNMSTPTQDERLLDILACSDNQHIHDVIVDDAGNVSDHRLSKASFHVSKRWTPVTNKVRPLSNMDFDLFEQSLLSSSLFTDPENTVDSFVDQLRNVVTSTLERLAPIRTVDQVAVGRRWSSIWKTCHYEMYSVSMGLTGCLPRGGV